MRSPVPVPDTESSLTQMLEYGLTAALVIVVIAAVLEICGLRLG